MLGLPTLGSALNAFVGHVEIKEQNKNWASRCFIKGEDLTFIRCLKMATLTGMERCLLFTTCI